jgi:ketosteroid isomerase-like protein
MTRKIVSLLAGCALVVSCVAASHAATAGEAAKADQELMQIERNWCSALVKNDAAALGAILADDYTAVSRTGKLTNKTQDLADMNTDKVTVCDTDMMQVRVYGDAAVVVGRTTLKSATFSGQIRWTDTYVRKGGGWQCVATQDAEIKQ